MPERFAPLLRLNPMIIMLDLFRAPLYAGALPDPTTLALAAALSIASLLVGWLFFTRRVDEFAYRI